MSCYCFLRNIVDLLEDDTTPYQRKFQLKWAGPIYPFGAQVTYQPKSDADKDKIKAFGAQTLNGLFAGYELQQGCRWSGNLLVFDWDNLEKATHASQINIRIVPSKEVLPVYIPEEHLTETQRN